MDRYYLIFNNKGKKYLDRIPQYVTQYPKLMELMGYILEYIDNSINEINKILPTENILSQCGLNYLQSLAGRYNLTINKSEYASVSNYRELLFGAIAGIWSTLLSKGDRKSLQTILDILYPGTQIGIQESEMLYRATMSTIDVVEDVSEILALWLKTDITGVTEIFEFNNKNSFKWEEWDTINNEEVIPEYIENSTTVQAKDSSYKWLSVTTGTTTEIKTEVPYTIDGVAKYKTDCGIYKMEYV